METITKIFNVYSFDELSEEAKEFALDKARENFDYFWADDNYNTLQAFEKIFPIEHTNFEYGYRNFINYKLDELDVHNFLSGIRLLKHIINNYYDDLFKPKHIYNRKLAINDEKQVTGYSKIQKTNCCVLTGYHIDNEILKPIYDFLKKPDDNVTFEDLLCDCLQSWLIACGKDYQYCFTNEYLSEHFVANDYKFLESGEIYFD